MIFALLFLTACMSNKPEYPIADTVISNGHIYTMETVKPWVEAVAIEGGRYIYVGTNAGVKKHIGERTQVIDAEQKMIMPGINDAHVHPARGGVKDLFECNFSFDSIPEQIKHTVSECVANNPTAVWIRGGQWSSGFFEKYKIGSPRDFLDKVSGDKAVLLSDDSNHNGWANSKALELSGIDKDTTNPLDGEYLRDAKTGIPNGLLLESAEQTMYEALPPWTEQQIEMGAARGVEIANSFGITGMKEASSLVEYIKAYYVLDQSARLNAHIATSIRPDYGHREATLDYDAIDQLRDKYKSRHVHTNFVKIYLDGVPTASRTAAMLSPYLPRPGTQISTMGMLHITSELLASDLLELDKRGYIVKIHTAGDRSVRVALDAIAKARQTNGMSGLRHELAHAGYIDDADIPRFIELDAVADLSPYIWHPSPIIKSVLSAVGKKRGEKYWPIKTLVDQGVQVLAGSDWPAAVSSIDPWVGIEAMVTRQDPRENTTGWLWPEQAINLPQALKIYTVDGARALGLAAVTGSIKVGKSADLIVLNHHLFKIDPTQINQTRVELTLFEGRVVHRY